MPTPTDDREGLHETASELLRARGHRYTTARRDIVTALSQAEAPLTIPQLLAIVDRLAQSSTYRNVLVLEAAGVTSRVSTPDGHARFELDERVTNHHHHHLICTDCGDVRDFELPVAIERSLQREFGRAGRAATFRIVSHRIDLLGACASCC